MHASEEAQGSNYWLDFWLDQRLAGVTYVPVAKAAPLYVFVAPAATYVFVAPAAMPVAGRDVRARVQGRAAVRVRGTGRNVRVRGPGRNVRARGVRGPATYVFISPGRDECPWPGHAVRVRGRGPGRAAVRVRGPLFWEKLNLLQHMRARRQYNIGWYWEHICSQWYLGRDICLQYHPIL
jgi:hypothetical protein